MAEPTQSKLRANDERCPHCDVSLQGEPIPREDQELYGSTHYSRIIGVYSRTTDRIIGWRCPDCNGEWPRV